MVLEGDQLHSTWGHRAVTGTAFLLIGSLFAEGVSEISTPLEAGLGVSAFLFAYYLSGDQQLPLKSARSICTACSCRG